MNDPEVTMRDTIATTGLAAHSEALEAAVAVIKLVIRLPTSLEPMNERVIRSAGSMPASLVEGHGRSGRHRLHLWRMAYASANEVDSHLRLRAATGALSRSATQTALGALDRVRTMTWRLLDSKS